MRALKSPDGMLTKAWRDLVNRPKYQTKRCTTTVEQYMLTGDAEFSMARRGDILCCGRSQFVLIHDNCVYPTDTNPTDVVFQRDETWDGEGAYDPAEHSLKVEYGDIKLDPEYPPPAVLVSNIKRSKANTRAKCLLLWNADTRDDTAEDTTDVPESDLAYDDIFSSVKMRDYLTGPWVSFRCLAEALRLNGLTRVADAAQLLATGKVVIVDFTEDEQRKVTRQQAAHARKLMNKYPELRDVDLRELREAHIPPAAGFTLVRGRHDVPMPLCWHRPATVLFRYGTKTFIMGQDEGAYFACELADHPKTVTAAFVSLKPKSIRAIEGIVRQGEWYVVPAKKNT